jgi:hypothetical protein
MKNPIDNMTARMVLAFVSTQAEAWIEKYIKLIDIETMEKIIRIILRILEKYGYCLLTRVEGESLPGQVEVKPDYITLLVRHQK